MSLILLVILVLGVGIAMPSVNAAESYDFVAKWGSTGTGDGQFKNPEGIAVDSNGNVYVSDSDNHRIQKFSPTGGD